jgi:hypothetical protein
MPTVRGGNNGHMGGQVTRNSEHRDTDIQQMHSPDKARDDLKGAYAGKENEAKFSREKHSTNVKARNTKKSKDRTPEM